MLRKVPILSIFLSTLSLRRATYQDKFSIPSDNISIHALLAESDQEIDNGHETSPYISIHALLAESDEDMILEEQMEEISIHALLAESDSERC